MQGVALGRIVLVGWTFWDDDLERGAEGRGTIRRDGVVAGIITRVWPDKPSEFFPGQREHGVDVTVFPPRSAPDTTYAPFDHSAVVGLTTDEIDVKPSMWVWPPRR